MIFCLLWNVLAEGFSYENNGVGWGRECLLKLNKAVKHKFGAFVFDDNGQSIILFWKCIISGGGGDV